MQELPKGGNCALSGDSVSMEVRWSPELISNLPLHVVAILLDEQQKVRGMSDVVHRDAREAPGVSLALPPGSASVVVNFAALPAGTERVVLAAFPPASGTGLNQANSLEVSVPGVVRYAVDNADRKGEVIALCELYLRKGAWKFRALGAEKSGGISALLSGYGSTVKLGGAPALAAAAPPPMPAASAGAASTGGINLNKISLEKSGDNKTINLDKNKLNQEILINLNWDGAAKKKKLFSLKRGIDLDLGAFFEMHDGGKLCIDGLQFSNGRGGPRHTFSMQGCYTDLPWIWHTGDDRSGAQMAQGENILINPRGFKDIKRLHVYAYIYEGAAKWAETNAVVSIKVPGNPELEVAMGEQRSRLTFCMIASLDFSPNSVKVTRHITFHQHHGDADKRYNWGLKWGRGSK